MSQCVSCNNQPNDNDSLGGGTHEGAVTPMVVGIIAGTVAVFVLVLCALFYCAKLENDKARRTLKAAEEADDNTTTTLAAEMDHHPPQQQQKQKSQPRPADDEGVEMRRGGGEEEEDEEGARGGSRQYRRRPEEELGAAKSGSGERRPSSVTVVAGEVDDSRCGAGAADTNGSWTPAGVVGGRKKGLFGWGGGKKSNGRATPADNPPVTAIEMV